MSIARVSGNDSTGTSATASITVNYALGSTTPNNLLLAAVLGNGTTHAVAIAGWTLLATQLFNSSTPSISVFYKSSTGDTSATATQSTSTAMQMAIFEYNGCAIPSAVVVDISNSGSNSTSLNSIPTASLLKTAASDLIFEVFGLGAAGGGSQSWTTATLLVPNALTRVIVGQYIPGTALSSYSDTVGFATPQKTGNIIVGFKAGIGNFINFF